MRGMDTGVGGIAAGRGSGTTTPMDADVTGVGATTSGGVAVGRSSDTTAAMATGVGSMAAGLDVDVAGVGGITSGGVAVGRSSDTTTAMAACMTGVGANDPPDASSARRRCNEAAALVGVGVTADNEGSTGRGKR
jgi:hypothetical protein